MVISVLVLCLLFGGELIYHSICPKIIHPAIHFLHVGISLVSPHFVSITNVNVYIFFGANMPNNDVNVSIVN